MDHYELLGLKKGATRKEIKKAYKRLASKSHPDKKSGNAETHKALTVAYNILSDDKRREQYDRTGDDSQATPSPRWEVLTVAIFNILISEKFCGDLIKEAKARMVSSSVSQDAILGQNKQAVNALRKEKGRIATKGGETNFYEGLICQKIIMCETASSLAADERDAITEAITRLEGYTDTRPEKPQGPGTLWSGGGG